MLNSIKPFIVVLKPILVAQPVKTCLESRICHFKGDGLEPVTSLMEPWPREGPRMWICLCLGWKSNSELAQPCDPATWAAGSFDHWTRNSRAPLKNLHLLICFYKLKQLWNWHSYAILDAAHLEDFEPNLETAHMTKLIHKSTSI